MSKQLTFFESENDHKKNTNNICHHWKLFIDGAARNNPGPAGAGIYILKDDKSVKKAGFYLGSRTNNQAEYAALLVGLFVVKDLMSPEDHLDIISDSLLLVKQFKGEYRVKHPELKPLHMIAKVLLHGITYNITHVLREKNEIADEMANVGIDQKKKLPQDFITLLAQHDITW